MSTLRDEIRVLEESDLFDAEWYVRCYRDVILLGMGAAEHYLRIGASLGRDPGPGFSTRAYLRHNPDVGADGINPLVHYVLYGRGESRLAETSEAGAAPTWDIADQPAEQVALVREAFDVAYYLSGNPDVAASGVDPFLHYMTTGWRLGRDPSPKFSTFYYLEHAPDVRQAGINPFFHYVLHGSHERRASQPYKRWLSALESLPTVTAIVPNYNHARFLRQRIDSILEQTYPNVEVLLLDDCSTDDSREVIAEYVDRYPDRVRAILNEENAGNVFRQWRKGLEAATGDLVWICESDDFCEPDFLDWLVPHFRDRSVQVAFGRIQFATPEGDFQPGLDDYREGAEPGIWGQVTVRPAARWFAGGFGVNNVIANVGGCVIRRQALAPEVWEEAQSYTILGDWFLYSHLAGGGQVAYDPSAIAYFRQHGANTSVTSFKGTTYYEEHQRLMTHLRERWPIPDETVDSFVSKVAFQYRHFEMEANHGPLEKYVDAAALKKVARTTPHLLMAFLGFHPGGGEVFPIALANALRAEGWLVTMFAYDMSEVNEDMAASLDSGIPVYNASAVSETGVDRFLRDAGVSLIHSHMVSLDHFFLEKNRINKDLPYLVSLHGSYEGSGISRERVESLVGRVDHWVSTAERNLQPFEGILEPGAASRLPNGMPVDPLSFPKTRAELGIGEDAVLFTFVARGVPGKGWDTATAAFARLREQLPDVAMHLALCGTGQEADRAQALWGEHPEISFLGFQARINGLYRISDVALVPTRFPGESYPLCVIQALQEGLPVLATDNGEIKDMVTDPSGEVAGRLVPFLDDDDAFVDVLVEAMRELLDPAEREQSARVARDQGHRFDISTVAAQYGELYAGVLQDRGTSVTTA